MSFGDTKHVRSYTLLPFLSTLICLVALFFGIALLPESPRSHAAFFLAFYCASFFVYALAVRFMFRAPEKSLALMLRTALVAASLIALALLYTTTNISTDIYRYVWDGGLSVHGINPYLSKPEDVTLPVLRDTPLYALLDWKDQYAVYPPLAQALFVVAYWLYSALGLVWVKLFFAAPILVWLMVLKKHLPRRIFMLALLNPLLLFEAFNGGHLEIYAIAFLLLSYDRFTSKRFVLSAVFLAFSVLTKIYPIIFLPLFMAQSLRERGVKSALSYATICLSIVGVWYLPLFSHLPFLLERYSAWVQVMVFNASIYEIFLHAFSLLTAHPAVWATRVSALFLMLGVCVLAQRKLAASSLLSVSLLFLVLSSVVYPWYTLVALPFAFLAAAHAKAPERFLYALLLMQFLVSCTYFTQIQSISYPERAALLAVFSIVEYGALALLVFNRKKFV